MADVKASEERYRAPALDKGLDILEFLSGQPQGMTRAEIVKAIGRSPGEIYRMLERLVARNYVSRSVEGDRYALTMKLLVLGSQHPPVRRLVSHAQPLMDQFSEKMQQSVHLAIQEGGEAVVVAQASGPANWDFRLRVGARLDLVKTSSGQTLLAFQSKERRDLVLSATPDAATGRQRVVVEETLDAIRATGYRAGDSLQLAGVRDISVPVIGPGGDAVAVITCPFLRRIDKETASEPAIIDGLMRLAASISIA